MNISIVLMVLLVGAIFTYFSGNKWASKFALAFSLGSFALTILALTHFNAGENLNVDLPWLSMPEVTFALHVDGLSLAMLLLTTGLLPLIIGAGFISKFENAKALYALILIMGAAMAGTF